MTKTSTIYRQEIAEIISTLAELDCNAWQGSIGSIQVVRSALTERRNRLEKAAKDMEYMEEVFDG